MRDDSPNKGISDFLKSISGVLTFVIGIVTAVVGLIKLWQGNTGLVTWVLLAISIGTLWLSLLYIYFKKKVEASQIWGSPEEKFRKPAYSKSLRRLAFVGIIVVPTLIAGFVGWKYYQGLLSNKIIILVADFEGHNLQQYRVTGNIVDQLREATKKYDDVEVKVLDEAISYRRDNDYAHTIGAEHNASLVLWGEYALTKEEVQIIVHFEVLQNSHVLPCSQEKLTMELLVAARELENFEFQMRLSSGMTYFILLTIGLANYEAQDYDSAIVRFTDALNQKIILEQMINPANVYFYRGDAYFYKGKYDHAIADFDQAVELDPNFACGYFKRGDAYKNKGEYDHAISNFNQFINLEPGLADAHISRGNVYSYKGEYAAAVGDYTQAIDLKPDYADAYYNRGSVYLRNGKYDFAVHDFDKAIELKLNFTNAYYVRGVTYFFKGDYKRAIADFRKVTYLQPKAVDAYFNLGLSQRQLLDHLSAINSLKQAMRLGLGKNQPYGALLLADSLKVLGGSIESKKPLQEALASLESSLWPSDLLKLYLDKATPEAVLETAAKAKEEGNLGPSCEAGFYVGLWYLRLDKKEKAKVLFKQSLEDKVAGYIAPPMAEEMLKQMEKEKSQK